MKAYKGKVRGQFVELPLDADLADGSEVVVMVPEPTGSIRSLLAALSEPGVCTREFVDVLDAAINEGRNPTWALRRPLETIKTQPPRSR